MGLLLGLFARGMIVRTNNSELPPLDRATSSYFELLGPAKLGFAGNLFICRTLGVDGCVERVGW